LQYIVEVQERQRYDKFQKSTVLKELSLVENLISMAIFTSSFRVKLLSSR